MRKAEFTAVFRPHALASATALALLAGCGKPADPTATASTEAVAPAMADPAADAAAGSAPAAAPAALPDRLDCLRQSGGVLLIGHRGGPTRDYPENAIETFDRTYKAGTRAMEIDIAETSDGVLFLMHDDDLDRTTTGEGPVSDLTWDEISALKLETYSKPTDFAPPTLADALAWAVRTGAVVELDKKRSTEFAPIIAAVRAAKAENNVFIITYSDAQAIAVHGLAPDLVITATVESLEDLDDLLARGVQADRLIAWTGTSEPKPALWRALAERGVESAFGTLGPRGDRLDDVYWEDDDGSEYRDLLAGGLPILVTDITDKVARELAEPAQKARACGF